jgi:hypothetical protein
MTISTIILLPSTTHTGDSTESTIIGDAFKGAGFFSSGFGLHTTSYQTNEFVGSIKIQAALATTPTEDDWFDVNGTEFVAIDSTTEVNTFNFIGNFVWIRTYVVFNAGTVTRILVNY